MADIWKWQVERMPSYMLDCSFLNCCGYCEFVRAYTLRHKGSLMAFMVPWITMSVEPFHSTKSFFIVDKKFLHTKGKCFCFFRKCSLKAKTIEYPRRVTCIVLNGGKMQRSIWPLNRRKSHLLNERVKSIIHNNVSSSEKSHPLSDCINSAWQSNISLLIQMGQH